jgi:hypothetical protein
MKKKTFEHRQNKMCDSNFMIGFSSITKWALVHSKQNGCNHGGWVTHALCTNLVLSKGPSDLTPTNASPRFLVVGSFNWTNHHSKNLYPPWIHVEIFFPHSEFS